MTQIPGFATLIADGQLKVSTSSGGRKLILLGTTTNPNLPLLEPVKIADLQTGIAGTRHSNGDPSELSLALEEAIKGGARNLEVMVVAAESGEADAYASNSRYDALTEAYEALRAHPCDFIFPVGAHIDDPGLSGSDTDGRARTNFARQLADACYRMSTEGNTTLGVIGAMPINRAARKEAWTDAPTSMTGELFDTPTRAHLAEWVRHLTGSDQGEDHSAEVLTADGFLAGSVEDAPGQLSAAYDFWVRDENDVLVADQNGHNVDGGAFIHVVAACAKVGGSETKLLANKYASSAIYRVTNGAAGYAGLLTTLEPMIGTTMQAIPGLVPLRELNRSQQQAILDARFNTLASRNAGYVVLRGITGAHNASDDTRSDYTMSTTIRIALACQDLIQQAAEPYIGKPATVSNMNSLETAIDAALNGFKKAGALRRYDFDVVITPDSMVLGRGYIPLTLVPAYELTDFTIHVALAKE